MPVYHTENRQAAGAARLYDGSWCAVMQLIIVCSAYLPTSFAKLLYYGVRLKAYLVSEESQDGEGIFSILLGELMELVWSNSAKEIFRCYYAELSRCSH
jgi:hypothetical protein